MWIPLIGVVFVYLSRLFPTGELLSGKWRILGLIGFLGTFLLGLRILLIPGPLSDWAPIVNPFGANSPWTKVSAGLGMLLIMASVMLSAVSLSCRFAKSSGLVREQLKSFVYASGLLTAALVVDFALIIAHALTAVIMGLALATTMAVLHYRLCDVDIVINRTLGYVPLTAILAGVYIAATGLAKSAFASFTGEKSDAAIAFITLMVVALFTPLKNSLQSWVDRRFKESYDPARELAKFEKELRMVLQVFDSRQVAQRFLDKAVLAFQADAGSIYVGSNGNRDLVAARGPLGEGSGIAVPIGPPGAPFGELTRRGDREYSEKNLAALRRCAAIVGQAMSLGGLK